MNSEESNQNAVFAPRRQLMFFRHPVEVYHSKYDEPMTVCNDAPIFSSSTPISATKQAFLDMANSPIMNLEEFEDCANFDDSAQEILLSDSDDEDADLIHMQNDQDEDADTAIDSDDLDNFSNEECMEGLNDFEEPESQNVFFESSDLKANKNILRPARQNASSPNEVSNTLNTASAVHSFSAPLIEEAQSLLLVRRNFPSILTIKK